MRSSTTRTFADLKSPCTSCAANGWLDWLVASRRNSSTARSGTFVDCSESSQSEILASTGNCPVADDGSSSSSGQCANEACSRANAAPAARTWISLLTSSSSPTIRRCSPTEAPATSTCRLPPEVATGVDTGRPSSPSQLVSVASAASRAKRFGSTDHFTM